MSVYCFSDLHGQYSLWEQIKNFIKPTDVVYCLGDCADRGPNGWKIIKEVLNTSNIIYIRGNHEQFILDEDYELWQMNGGISTICSSELESDEEYNKIRLKLAKTPLILNYTNKNGKRIALCHAGFDPEIIAYQRDEDLLWDREHIGYSWPEKNWSDLYLIHGHTPIQFINRFTSFGEKKASPPQAYWYCNDHKCCIDQGSFLSGNALLLNLDTFEEHIFTAEVEKYE